MYLPISIQAISDDNKHVAQAILNIDKASALKYWNNKMIVVMIKLYRNELINSNTIKINHNKKHIY